MIDGGRYWITDSIHFMSNSGHQAPTCSIFLNREKQKI